MFIPLAETPLELRPGGEERNVFAFYERDPGLPVEVKITRLPPGFDPDLNWHKHQYIEEFSVPLIGEIVVKEDKKGKVSKKMVSRALLKRGEWVAGIECKGTKSVDLFVETRTGRRRKINVEFEPDLTEGVDWHTVGNPTKNMVVMLTLKRVPRRILKRDPLVFQVDREKKYSTTGL